MLSATCGERDDVVDKAGSERINVLRVNLVSWLILSKNAADLAKESAGASRVFRC